MHGMAISSLSFARLSAIALAPWLSFGALEALSEQNDKRTRTGVVAVVGKWSQQTIDGDAQVSGDGAAEAMSATSAGGSATALFGKVEPAFVTNVTAPTAFALAVLPEHGSVSGGTYRAEFNLVSGASDQTAGLVFDLRPTGEYLFVRYNTREGNIALWRYADGTREVVARTTDKVQLPLGTWHRISLSINGTRITGLINDTLRLEHDLQRPVQGHVGFWTKRDSVTKFRQIALQRTH
jgi:hypothetical protein